MVTRENRNTTCMHTNKVNKHEMLCFKITLIRRIETEMITLLRVTFSVQKLRNAKGSSFKRRCHFLFCILHLWESGAAVVTRHRAICEGDSTTHRAFEMHRACFHTFPITVEQKIEKIVSKTGSFPTSGLEL